MNTYDWSNTSKRRGWTYEDLGIADLESSAKERAGFPRYSVRVDGKTLYPKTRKALENLLADIITDEKVRAFRNGGKGVTIDFDNN